MILLSHLKTEFEKRCRKNSNYSLRAYARFLDIDPSILSAILNQRRPLKVKTALKIMDRLEFQNPEDRLQIIKEVSGIFSVRHKTDYVELSQVEMAIVSQWEHFAILSLLELKNFTATKRKISERLNIPFGTVLSAIDHLEQLGFIKMDNGRYIIVKKNIVTTTDVPSAELKKGHREYIEKAVASLDLDPVETRDITGITMAINSSKIPRAKLLIKAFRRQLCEFLEEGKKDEVYRLNVQLFPLTKTKKEKL